MLGLIGPTFLVETSRLTKNAAEGSPIQPLAEVSAAPGSHGKAVDDRILGSEGIFVRLIAPQEIIGPKTLLDGIADAERKANATAILIASSNGSSVSNR